MLPDLGILLGSSQTNYRDKTNALLDKIAEWSYCMGQVPVYVMADFNQDPQAITAFHTMQLYGWKDLLAEAYERADKPCPPTYLTGTCNEGRNIDTCICNRHGYRAFFDAEVVEWGLAGHSAIRLHLDLTAVQDMVRGTCGQEPSHSIR